MEHYYGRFGLAWENQSQTQLVALASLEQKGYRRATGF
jgi:hypothetical protein